MEGILASVVSGVSGPIAAPFVRRGEAWFRLRGFTERPIPAVLCPEGVAHECPQYKDFLAASKDLLKKEPWMRRQFGEAEVPMKYVASVLRNYEIWPREDADSYRQHTLLILGPQKASERLAVLMGVISDGGLKKGCCGQATIEHANQDSDGSDTDSATEDSFVTCKSHLLEDSDDGEDGAIDMRPSVEHHSFGRRADCRDPRTAFGECEPYDGLPVVISKVVVNLEIEILCQPSRRVCLDGRRIRDLGRLMYDPRGSFDIQVVFAWRMYTPLGEVRSLAALPPPVRDCFGEGGLWRLCYSVDELVFDRICNGSDGRYRRPVRPATYDDSGVVPFRRLGPQRPRNWGTKWERVDRWSGWTPMRILMNRNQRLSPECREFYKALRFLGVPIEPADLDCGIFWVVEGNWYFIYLGHLGDVTQTDLDQYYKKLEESGYVREDIWFYGWGRTKKLSDDPQRRYYVWNYKTEEKALRRFAGHIPWRDTPVYVS